MSSSGERVAAWNRRLHYYLGLYFLVFLWLFAATGLMLNHQQWFTGLYDRAETEIETAVTMPPGDDLARARTLMRQLDLRGEIDWPATSDPGVFAFNVSRPTDAAQIRVDLSAGRASVRRFGNRPLHAFQVFHTFSGSRFNQPDSRRDWVLTTLWVWGMDALAGGLVLMVLGSYYMWYRVKATHLPGAVALAAGLAGCALFLTPLLP